MSYESTINFRNWPLGWLEWKTTNCTISHKSFDNQHQQSFNETLDNLSEEKTIQDKNPKLAKKKLLQNAKDKTKNKKK